MSKRLAVDLYVSCKKCGVIATSDAATRTKCPICQRPVTKLSQKEIRDLEETL